MKTISYKQWERTKEQKLGGSFKLFIWFVVVYFGAQIIHGLYLGIK